MGASTFREFAFDGSALRTQVLRGGSWLGAGTAIEQALRLGRNMLLTRLLAPEAFGTMAIVMSISTAVESFTQIGLREALIQNPKGHDENYVNAAWWLAVGRGVVLYLLAFAVAPSIADFYRNSELTLLLRVGVLSILFSGAMSAQAWVGLKEMKFKRWAVIYHGGGICGILITVLLSLYLRNVWALAIGFAAEAAAACFLSHLLCPFRPRLRIDRSPAGELLRFSRGVVGLPFLNFIFLRADIFVVGKLYSAEQLGLYGMAVNLAQVPAIFMMNLLGQVMMPAFSQLQAAKERTNQIFLEVTRAVAFLGLPLLIFVIFYGRSLIRVLYGASYSATATCFVVACFTALINTVNGPITTVFYANGRPQLHRRFAWIRAILMVLLIYPFVRWFGLIGAALAGGVAILIGYLFQVRLIGRLTALNLNQYSRIFLLASAISLSVIAIRFGTQPLTGLARPLPNLLSGLFGCLLSYGLYFVIRMREKKSSA